MRGGASADPAYYYAFAVTPRFQAYVPACKNGEGRGTRGPREPGLGLSCEGTLGGTREVRSMYSLLEVKCSWIYNSPLPLLLARRRPRGGDAETAGRRRNISSNMVSSAQCAWMSSAHLHTRSQLLPHPPDQWHLRQARAAQCRECK